MKIEAKTFLSALLLIVFVGTGAYSFSHALQMERAGHHTSSCPSDVGSESLCVVSPLKQIIFWQKTLTSDSSFGLLLLLATSGVLLVYVRRSLFDIHSPPLNSRIRISNANLPIGLYAQIFSDGLLNPKAP